MNDGDDLFRAICRKPSDFTRYLIYADWLEEQDDLIAADAWRWMGVKEKRPHKTNSFMVGQHVALYPHKSKPRVLWMWKRGDLPMYMISDIEWVDIRNTRFLATYYSLKEAFQDFVICWGKLTAEQTDRLWNN